MNTRFVERKLDGDSVNYINRSIQDAGKTISRLSIEINQLDCLKIISFLPSNIENDLLPQYERGGICSSQESNAWLVRKIREFLRERKDHIVIFEDASAKSTDPFLSDVKYRPFYYQEEVYFSISSTHIDDPDYIEGIRRTSSSPWRHIGVMTSCGSPLLGDSNVNLSTIEELARHAQHLIVSAYDGESYIISSFSTRP